MAEKNGESTPRDVFSDYRSLATAFMTTILTGRHTHGEGSAPSQHAHTCWNMPKLTDKRAACSATSRKPKHEAPLQESASLAHLTCLDTTYARSCSQHPAITSSASFKARQAMPAQCAGQLMQGHARKSYKQCKEIHKDHDRKHDKTHVVISHIYIYICNYHNMPM